MSYSFSAGPRLTTEKQDDSRTSDSRLSSVHSGHIAIRAKDEINVPIALSAFRDNIAIYINY